MTIITSLRRDLLFMRDIVLTPDATQTAATVMYAHNNESSNHSINPLNNAEDSKQRKLEKERLLVKLIKDLKVQHDLSRKTADGKGSWPLLEKNLLRFRELREKHGVAINLVSTINKSTCRHIYYNYTRLFELTGMNIFYLFIHEDAWEQSDFDAIKEQVMLLQEYGFKNKLQIPLCATGYGTNQSGKGAQSADSRICNAGIGTYSVNHAGDIFSCHRAYYYGAEEVYKLGNVETGFNRDNRAAVRELNSTKNLPMKCQQCHPVIRTKCHVCVASNKAVYGDFHKVADGYCTLLQDVHEMLVAGEEKNREMGESG
jgi:radical SAM protein with 4Fe4S-binding SPASM domain